MSWTCSDNALCTSLRCLLYQHLDHAEYGLCQEGLPPNERCTTLTLAWGYTVHVWSVDVSRCYAPPIHPISSLHVREADACLNPQCSWTQLIGFWAELLWIVRIGPIDCTHFEHSLTTKLYLGHQVTVRSTLYFVWGLEAPIPALAQCQFTGGHGEGRWLGRSSRVASFGC